MIRGDNRKITRIIQYFILPSLILGFLCMSGGCLDVGEEAVSNTFVVAVTLGPQEEFVREVGGDRVEIVVLLPRGADPHIYEPEAGQMMDISRSDIYFRIGDGFLPFEDRFVARLGDLNSDLVVVDTSQGIDLLDENTGNGKDPHIWLSLRNAGIMVDTIYDALVLEDPAGEAYYAANRDAYQARLKLLDMQIRENATGMARVFIVTHSSWGYFARDYGLEQVSIETGGKEATARDLEKIVTIARKNNISVIFAEPQFSSRGADVIAREIGGSVEFIDPMSPDYLENMENVAQKVTGSMS